MNKGVLRGSHLGTPYAPQVFVYSPGFTTKTVSSTTATLFDSVNLVTTWAAPPSGSLLVDISVNLQFSGTGGQDEYIDIIDVTTGKALGSCHIAFGLTITSYVCLRPNMVITGLTPGGTYKVGLGAHAGNAGTTVGIEMSGSAPVIMTATAL